MSDNTEEHPDPTQADNATSDESDAFDKRPIQKESEQKRATDKDDTRPNRRIMHPDRTRLTPAQKPSPLPPAGAPPEPAAKSAEPDEAASPSATPPAHNVTRPTKPIKPPERPAFTQKRPGQQTTRVQPPIKQNSPTRQPTHYQNPLRQNPTKQAQQPPPQIQRPTVVAKPQQPDRPKLGWRRRIVRGLAALSLISIIIGALLLAAGVVTYFWIASQLPPAETLLTRSFQFRTSQILDRNGNLLWEIIDPTGGRRTQVPLDQISPDLVNATVATEDRFFYANVGVDPIAVTRAIYYNVTEGEIVSGASTITQQLARNILLAPEERAQQTITRKVREAVLAVEISRRYRKDQILEIYLNQIYYGNLAYGIEAASQTYFGKSAGNLTLPEAAMLAGLPQSPAIHDPYINPEGAARRQADVLRLMVEANYLSATEAAAARNEPLQFRDVNFAFEAPHFVSFVRQELERIYGPDLIYQVGVQVQTTLDPRLQAIAEEEVRNQVNAIASRNVSNGAMIAMDVSNGQILAFVGSKNFDDEAIGGQINMATVPRQPGSSIKPLTYLTAFEQLNWTPSTLIMDTPVEYPDGAGGVYAPLNYNKKFNGPVSVRSALANSYNIPPVKALAILGVSNLQNMAARLGITSLTRNDYGLALTLGSGEVSVLELTGAYQAMANQGVLVPPTSIIQISDPFGVVIEPVRPQPRTVLREEHAYLISHILNDNEARTPAFGPNSVLRLSRPAAVKTGTTNDFRDSWTVGYTPEIVTGVWVGNADNTPMNEIGGSNGAGVIWHNFMERAHEGQPIRDFTRPATIVELEVCADSGTLPSEACPERRNEIFYQEQPPLGPEHDIHQIIEIDRATGLRANDFCRSNIEQRYFRIYPPDGVEWAIAQGFAQPPLEFCPSADIVAEISNPLDGSTARGTLQLEGSVSASNFSHYQIEIGLGTTPDGFAVITEPVNQMVERGILGVFDTSQVDNGPYTLRLIVYDRTGGQGETRVRVLVDNVPTPAPTTTPTPTSTPSPTATNTPLPSTDTPTATPTLEPPTATPLPPTDVPPETPVPPTAIPTETPTVPVETPTDVPTALPPTPVETPAESPTPDAPLPTNIPAETPTAPTATPTETATVTS